MCENLKRVSIGSGVKEIASDAFNRCNAIESFYIDLEEGSLLNTSFATDFEITWKQNN